MNIEIRGAALTDAEAIHELSVNELGYNVQLNIVTKQLKVVLKSTTDRIFVAETDGNVVGYIHLSDYNSLYFKKLINVMGLAVKTEYQRQGIGRMLMEKAERYARRTDAVGIRLASGKTREGAHEFYKALGYECSKEQLRFMKQWS